MQLLIENLEIFLPIIMLIIISILLRILLQVLGQVWINTIAHTSTITLLPILVFVITKVISGNIALSLGMVGALSIVRFRNPVRSPLELSVYFGAITMGIAAAVSINWLVFLVASVLLAVISLTGINWASKLFFRKPFFITSFSEGNSLSTLEITSTIPIETLETHDELNTKSIDEGKFSYVLASSNFGKLRDLQMQIQDDVAIISMQLSK